MINKKVWAYWDDDSELPILEQKCLSTWEKNLDPSWEITLVRRSNVTDYLDKSELPINFEKLDKPQRRSDATRLALLAKYGGVYLDCTVILRENLDWVEETMNKKKISFMAETHDPKERIHSVWFMAAMPDSVFMKEWSKEANKEMETKSNLVYDRIQNLSPEIRDRLPDEEKSKVGFINSAENGLCLVKGVLNPNSGPIDKVSFKKLKKHENKLGHNVRLIKLNRKPREEVREHLNGKKRLKSNSAIVKILELDETKSTSTLNILGIATLILVAFILLVLYVKNNKN
jgi:hypothetical protein